MAYRPDGPVAASDVFLNIVKAASTNLSQISLLNHQRDFSSRRVGGLASETFGTLTGARTPTKPFVVGFIPPDVDVSFVPVEVKKSETVVTGSPGIAAGSGGEPKKNPKTGVIEYPPSFYQKLKQVAENIKANPDDLLACLTSESGLDPSATNYYMDPKTGKIDKGSPQAIGLNQITRAALGASKMDEAFWRNKYGKLSAEEQLPYVQNYFLSVSKGRKFTNIGDLYMANAAAGAIGTSGDHVVFGDGTPSGGINVEQNPGLDLNKDGKITAGEILTFASRAKTTPMYKAQLALYQAAVSSGAGTSGGTGPSGSVMTNGTITDPENSDPLYNTGRNVQIASGPRLEAANAQTEELRNQIRVARSIPALMLLVNPQKLTRNYEPTIDPVKVRRGYAVHVWNERPLSISCSGETAAQYAFRSDGEGGLTHFNRLHSASYKNLMSLVQIYRNNGHIYRGVTNDDPYNEHVPILSMSVFIYYDGRIYVGSFDDFSLTDDGEKPFNMSYSFKFTVRYEVEVPSSGLGQLLL